MALWGPVTQWHGRSMRLHAYEDESFWLHVINVYYISQVGFTCFVIKRLEVCTSEASNLSKTTVYLGVSVVTREQWDKIYPPLPNCTNLAVAI